MPASFAADFRAISGFVADNMVYPARILPFLPTPFG
jgi:hypothetical protein